MMYGCSCAKFIRTGVTVRAQLTPATTTPPEAMSETPTQPENDTPEERKRPRPKRRWWRWLLEIALFVGVLLAVRAYMAPDLPKGHIAPLTVSTLSGKTVTLGQPGEKPTLVVFWATWCGICHVEMPWLDSLSKSEKGYRIVAIAMQSGSTSAVRKYLDKNGLDHLTVVNDPRGLIARRFGVTVTPTLLFFNPKGGIATAETGITSSWGIRLRLWWLANH